MGWGRRGGDLPAGAGDDGGGDDGAGDGAGAVGYRQGCGLFGGFGLARAVDLVFGGREGRGKARGGVEVCLTDVTT